MAAVSLLHMVLFWWVMNPQYLCCRISKTSQCYSRLKTMNSQQDEQTTMKAAAFNHMYSTLQCPVLIPVWWCREFIWKPERCWRLWVETDASVKCVHHRKYRPTGSLVVEMDFVSWGLHCHSSDCCERTENWQTSNPAFLAPRGANSTV